VLTITAITLKTVFNYLFVRLKNVLYGLGAAAAAVDFHAALSRRVQFTRQKRSDRGRAAGKIKNLCLEYSPAAQEVPGSIPAPFPDVQSLASRIVWYNFEAVFVVFLTFKGTVRPDRI